MKLLAFFLVLFFSQNLFAKSEYTQKITVGHQDVTMLEIHKEGSGDSFRGYVKRFRNGHLTNARALTEKTYELIQKDFGSVFTDKKDDRQTLCSSPIRVELSYSSDAVKNMAICEDSWSKAKRKSFSKFYKKLLEFSSGQSDFYE